METLIVDGPTPLKGEIEVAGAKNSMSKLLTASMLTAEPCEFTNVPAIGDTEITKAICEALGAHCSEIGPKALLVETPDHARSCGAGGARGAKPAIGDDVGAVSASPRPGGSAGGRR